MPSTGGSTRRRPVPSTSDISQLHIQEPPITPLRSSSRKWKRCGRKVLVLILMTVSFSVVIVLPTVVLVLSTLLAQMEEQPHPMIRSVPQPPMNDKLLALLYPPGLIGGYRNQVIRFLSFTVYAMQRNISSLLLPSIQWSTQVGNSTSWVPIPMDLLMDIDHWNSFYPKLPLLVDHHTSTDESYDCWFVEPDVDATLLLNASKLTRYVVSRGFLTPIYNLSKHVASQQVKVNVRRMDLLGNVSNDVCKHPMVYGGGKMAGRLWNDYLKMRNDIPYNAKALVLQALRPKQQWRSVATQCVQHYTSSSSSTGSSNNNNNGYIALHARVELEMMIHPCGKAMEKNLTKIFDMVSDLSSNTSTTTIKQQQQQQQAAMVRGVFIAVSRSGMEHQEHESGYKRFKSLVDENLVAMNRMVKHGLQNGRLPVFECGRQALRDYYYNLQGPDAIDYGSTLQSMINFHVATEATIFVGVRGSSYSTDIWTTRYYQGKGDTNYEYTPNGIVLMDNNGLPPAHSNCKKK